MRSDWPATSIGELVAKGNARLQTGPFGSQLHKHDYVTSGTRVIPTEAIGRGVILPDAPLPQISAEKAVELQRHRLQLGDILFARRGVQATGLSAVVGHKHVGALCGTGAILLRVNPDVLEPRFLAAYLATDEARNWLKAHAVGAVMPNLNTGVIAQLRVPIPPVAVQQEIAAFSSSLNGRIDLLRQTNATLESIAQALFKSWFIDFDPVRAKAEGREPEGMDAATAALFPAEFEESTLGLIPKGWRVATIRDVVADVYDGPHATPPEASEGAVFLGIKNLTGTSLDLGELRYISEDHWAQWTRRVTPQPDDIVFSYEAVLGLFALVPPDLRCCLGRRLALVRPKAEDGTPHFWLHQFVSAPFQRLLDKHTVHGATVNRIALKEFPSFTVLDPSRRARTAFEAVAQPLWARIHANRQQELKLAEVRDSLLPRLISGKLRLPEAREYVEETVA